MKSVGGVFTLLLALHCQLAFKLILPEDNFAEASSISSNSGGSYASSLGLAESVNDLKPDESGGTVLDSLAVEFEVEHNEEQENMLASAYESDNLSSNDLNELAAMEAVLLQARVAQAAAPSFNITKEDPNPTPTAKASVAKEAYDVNPEVLNSAPIYLADRGYFNQKELDALVWVGLILLLIFLKSFHYCCAIKCRCIAPELEMAYFAFFREVVFFFVVLCVIYVLTWFTVDFHSDLHEVAFGFTHFILVWFIWGLLVLLISDCISRKWVRYEKQIKFSSDYADSLKRKYDQLYMHKKHHALLPYLEYLVMRQEFITPSYLLALRESFKRPDFNFAKYLVLSLAQTLQRFFYLRLVSVLVCIAFTVGWHFMYKYSPGLVAMIVAVVTPLLFVLLTCCSTAHLHRIYKALVPPVDHPSYFNIQLDLDVIDPFEHYDRVVRPDFLGAHNDDERQSESALGDEDEHVGFNKGARKGKTSSPPRVCCCRKSNRQESLFCCGKVGISNLFNFQQILFLLACLWTTSFIFREAEVVLDHFGWVAYIVWGVVALFMLIFILIQLPIWLRLFTLDTSTQMMKRRGLEEEVLSQQIFNSALNSQRIYQTFKIIRRQFMEDMGQKNLHQVKLRRLTQRLLYEVFSQFRGKQVGEENVLSSKRCEEFVRACGDRLTEREKFVLLKNAESKDHITFNDMQQAVEAQMNDVMLDPQDVVKKVLIVYFSSREGELISNYNISIEDLFAFFEDFKTYFEPEDVMAFLDEVQLYMREKSDGLHINLNEIGYLVRDDIERLPK